jgi:hypothetical protein
MADNFTAGIPIQFVYDIDTRTLEGKGYDFDIGVTKVVNNKAEPIFREKIHAESKPCEWIASAKWRITPQAGKHTIALSVYADDGDSTSLSEQFFVKDNTYLEIVAPLKQFKSGTPIDQIQCREGFVVAIKASNENPACVKRGTLEKLREQGWAEPLGKVVFQKPSLNVKESDSQEYKREITILSISPQNVTLPEPKNQTHKTKCNADGVCFTPE